MARSGGLVHSKLPSDARIDVRNKNTPIQALDEEQVTTKYIAVGLLRMRQALVEIARRAENHALPVDEYNTCPIGGTASVSSLVVQPTYDQFPEKILSILVAGPPNGQCILTLGDRSFPLVIPAAGILPIGPVAMILGRDSIRQLTAVTPGQYFLELMGFGDKRFQILLGDLMSENNEELREAAAAGAAAAVSAVADEQAEEQRHEATEAAAGLATDAATEASSAANVAAEAATEAYGAASEAATEADHASEVSEAAAAEASEARSEVSELRSHIDAGFNEFRKYMEERLGPKQPNPEPTEVVVTHGNSGESTGQGSNAGSGGSASGTAASGTDRPRHRFGRRIS